MIKKKERCYHLHVFAANSLHTQLRACTFAAAVLHCLHHFIPAPVHQFPLFKAIFLHHLGQLENTLQLLHFSSVLNTLQATLQLGVSLYWWGGNVVRWRPMPLRFSVYLRVHLSSPPFVFLFCFYTCNDVI
jgi:hypothetical protein